MKYSKDNLALTILFTLSTLSCPENFVPLPAQASSLLAQSPAPAAPTIQEKIEFRRKTLRTMREDLIQTASFVQTTQFDAAQQSFAKALKKWYIFGGTIRRIAPESYAKISPGFESVKKGLYQPSVPLNTLKADLQRLVQAVDIAVPISDAQA